MNIETDIEKLHVEFYKVNGGEMYFRLICDKRVYESCFMEYVCPLLDLKSWLEAIVLGVQQTSFGFDNEADEPKFDARRRWIHNNDGRTYKTGYEFTIESYKAPILFQGLFEKKQFIRAFYTGIIDFYNSDKYNPREWETTYYKDLFYDRFKIDETGIIKKLRNLNQTELEDAIFEVYPATTSDYSGNTIRCKYIIFPDDYNAWDIEKKENFVAEIINYDTPHCNRGTPLKEFRSEIIEKYLNEE